jgi:hypothetical protein
VNTENVMAFHPRYWSQGVRNGSWRYDYDVDSECTGTTLRDFLRGTDLQRIDEEVALAYEGTTAGA